MLLRALTGVAGLLVLLLLADAAPAQTAPTRLQTAPTRLVYRDSTAVDAYMDAPAFEDWEAFAEWSETLDPRPIEVGILASPILDPEWEYPYLYAVERDSSAWIQAPDGTRMRIDPWVLWTAGGYAAERVGYDSLLVETVGYGWEDGRFYLYLTKSAPIVWLIVIIGLALVAAAVGLWVLRGRLREARERGEQLAESRRRLADSREAERMRLARELHDGPLQDLQAVRMQLGVAARSGGLVGEDGDQTDPVQNNVLRVITELREISEGLRPPVLASFGLAAALRALVDRLRMVHPGTVLSLSLLDPGTDLPDGARLTLYRIAQESLNNALAHGQPSLVTVRYKREADGALALSVSDDGSGFDIPESLHAFEAEGSLGLAGMAERAESIGGTLSLQSGQEGTEVSIHVPASSLFALPAVP